jgi:DNA-binding IclR family transcriptional regulator
LSIAAIENRMTPARQADLAAALHREAQAIAARLASLERNTP